MLQKISGVILRPDEFFSGQVKSAVELKYPIVIVLVAGILGAASGYLVGEMTARMFSGTGMGISQIMLASSVGGAFIGVFLMWLVIAGVLFVISLAFHGSGEFKRTLECTGWGFIPMVFSAIIGLILALYYVPQVHVPVLRSLQDPALIQAAVNTLMNDPAMFQFRLISSMIGIIFMLWSANIWIFGIRHARNLSARNAAITVMIPVAVYIIVTLYSLFSAGIPPGV